jgi:hypothetical protein
MPLMHVLMDAGKRMLARRLDHLFNTLENLRGQLRSTLANAVGETLGMLVRDSAMQVLEALPFHGREPPAFASTSRRYQPDMRGRSSYQEDRGYWDDDYEEDEELIDPIEPAPPEPVRLPTALSAGLQAAAWWLRRWPTAKHPLTVLTVTLTATAAAFFGGPLVMVMFGLAHAATHFSASP